MSISTARSAVPMVRPAGTNLVGVSIETFGFFVFGTAAVLASGGPFSPGTGPQTGTLFSASRSATRYPKDVRK